MADLVVDVATAVVTVCLVEVIMIAVDEAEEEDVDAVVEDVAVVVVEAVVVEWAGSIFKRNFLSLFSIRPI